MIIDFLFYMFSSILLLSAILVVIANNPVHNVLFLILGFFNAAGLFILLGAEFIAMLIVIVYVGAVAVMFLFVVMMMNINTEIKKRSLIKYLPFGIAIIAIFFIELYFVINNWGYLVEQQVITLPKTEITNVEQLGRVLYTDYAYIFIMSGIILFVAMIGSIILTLRFRNNVKKQKIHKQINRKVEDCIEIISDKTNKAT
ncbi:MAG: NADH-quinone oxidoreductase subunit J [Pseudomonadota bacterium]